MGEIEMETEVQPRAANGASEHRYGRHRVVIAGAGVGGLEALIGIHGLAGEQVDVTLLAPQSEFVVAAESVQEPFRTTAPHRGQVAAVCAAHGAAFVQDSLAAVDADSGCVTTSGGLELPFDSLVVAVGARRERVFGLATTFAGPQDVDPIRSLLGEIERGEVGRVAFVVPSGVTWSLPLYELALMTAWRVREAAQDDASFVLVTPEELPLAAFGMRAGAAVERALGEAGIEFLGGSYAERMYQGSMIVSPSGAVVRADRFVALPRLHGPRIRGVGTNDEGFIPVDEFCRVRGTRNVYAAGDGTSVPVKQGGLAAQQAQSIAEVIANRAGVDLDPAPFLPVLRAKLLTGKRPYYLQMGLGADEGEASSMASDELPWWPPAKVVAPHLAAYLGE